MDTDHYRGWLGFSLSNHQPYLLEALSSAQPHGGKLQVTEDERPGAAELAALAAVGPKMEDFLSGARGKPVGRLAGGETTDAIGIYGSELKNIATGFLRGLPTAAEQQDTEARKAEAPVVESRRVVDALGQRTSIYRGVTRHRWTGRYEAHLWDNSCRREGQSRKGRQVYLGGYDKEEKAARAYDLAALKYWGPSTTTNFLISNYETEMEGMKNMTRLEFVASLRRKSSGFSRGASIYRGVTKHHQHGRWQARIGRVAGNKDLYLGTFGTQEEAAEAYDIAAIKFRGLHAVTNFDMSRYDVKSITSSSLPIGGMGGRASKAAESSSPSSSDTVTFEAKQQVDGRDTSASLGFAAIPIKHDQEFWSLFSLQQQQLQSNEASSFGPFPSGVNMNFSAASNGVINQESAGRLVWNNGPMEHLQGQSQSSSSCSSMPLATPIVFGGNHEGSSYSGSWVTPPPSYYGKAAKPNVAIFQTPIFGME